MKKKITLTTTFIIISSLIILLTYKKDNNVTFSDTSKNNNNILSIMLETSSGSGDYQESLSNSFPRNGYIFNENLSNCENGSKISWNEENKSVSVKSNKADKCHLYFDIYEPTLAETIINLYTGTQGENSIYYHDSNLTNGANDNSYRYAGANPNNYVCFGSDESTCPTDNLYRIIGVFEENNHGVSGKKLVKIIKNDSYGTYEWHKKSGNDWSIADLNKTLNSTFLTAQLSGYEDKIQSVAWKISGLGNESGVAKGIYTVEVANATKTYEAKVGLMYLSDYAYVSSPSYWETSVFKYTAEVVATNWLYLDNKTQWVLTRASTDNYDVFSITNDGYVNGDNNAFSLYEVKPTFYLTSDILYAGGTGTLTDPYRTR